MKRHDIQYTEQNPSKKQKLNPLISYTDILRPLLESNKILENGNTIPENDRYTNEAYKEFLKNDNPNNISNSQRQLAQFITNQLATLAQGIPNKKAFDEFASLNIRTHRPTIEESASESSSEDELDNLNEYKLFYDPNNRSIALNSYPNPFYSLDNPLMTLIHEGTHALDDLYIRNSDQAINTLAKMEKPKLDKERNLLTQDHSWYEQAQNILNSPAFRTHYPLGSLGSEDSYGQAMLDEEQRKLITHHRKGVFNFRDVKNLIGDRENNYKNGFFEEPFTEFTAHSVENLHNPWNISNEPQLKNYWQKNNDGRKFLKAITKGVYRNFLELDPDFSTKYPDANKNFLDRITQLRNYDKPKGHTEDAYKKHLYKKFPQSNLYNNISSETPPQLGSFSNDNVMPEGSLQNLAALEHQYNQQYPDTWTEEELNLQMPLDGRPHPVDNSYYNNPPPGDSVPPYLQNPYPRTPSPKI